MSARLERKKKNAQAFYGLMFNDCKPREAIEHWDVLQVIPSASANDNTMF